jgi:hypothetical protein
MTYSEKLEHPLWQKRRAEIYARDNHTCQLCEDKETNLQVHHLRYVFGANPWESPDEDLITYCKHCHKIVEFLKKENMADFPIIKIIKYFSQLDPNDTILISAIVKLPDEERYSYLFFHWHPKTKTISFDLSLPASVIKSLFSENQKIIESNKSNG